jgi:DNA-binding LytR/AlgR family response regulator
LICPHLVRGDAFPSVGCTLKVFNQNNLLFACAPENFSYFHPTHLLCGIGAEEKYAFVLSVGNAKLLLVYHSLTEIDERLGEYAQFVRCHRSRLVNMAYCKSWKHAEKEAIVRVVYGETSKEITVSRTYKADFVRRWEEFVQRQ